MKKIYSSIIAISLMLFLFIPFFSNAVIDQTSAQNYLVNKPLTSWSVMALVASGQNVPNLDFLKNISGSEAIHFTAPILAITSTGNNPETFSNTNLIVKLKSFYNNKQMGDINSLNDDIFGLLALISSGEDRSSEMIQALKSFILQNQNLDGSWGFAIGSGDTDMTAAGIVALKASGVQSSDPSIQKALNYIKQNQTPEGGFLSSSAFDQTANSASTAWAIWAYNSLGISPSSIVKEGKNPVEFLESTQNPSGFFSYTPNSPEDSFSGNLTSYSLIAVSGKTLPLKIFPKKQEQFNFRIEGKNSTICQGYISGPSALDIIKNASVSCGFTYNITNTEYGPYLDQIATDSASGLIGWQYAINNESPNVGAADYFLKKDDSVLWYFGSWDDKITRLNLSNAQILSGESTTATVEYKESGSWKPLSGATITLGATNLTTNQSGQTLLSANDGYYQTFAEKTGFVRSNTLLLKIGEPVSNSSALSATIGQVGGIDNENPNTDKGASFTINSQNLDFGNLSKGQHAEKNITLTNNGDVNLSINSVVDGDRLFKENLTINNSLWKNFELLLGSGENKDVSTKLSVPLNYTEYGKKNGQIIFWAKSQN